MRKPCVFSGGRGETAPEEGVESSAAGDVHLREKFGRGSIDPPVHTAQKQVGVNFCVEVPVLKLCNARVLKPMEARSILDIEVFRIELMPRRS